MVPPVLPPGLADEMVEILFRESPPFEFRDVLLIGEHIEGLNAAINRYVANETGQRPTIHTVACLGADCDPEVVSKPTTEARFLSESFTPETNFDYVLGIPPTLPWDELKLERRREIAGFSPHISPEDRQVDASVMYTDRTEPLLAADGRAVLLGQTELKTAEKYTGFRKNIADDVRDVEAIDDQYEQFAEPWFIIAVDHGGDAPFAIDERAVWADPTKIEAQLSASATRSREKMTVETIMTPLSEMDVYDCDDDAAMVYLDMLYEDFDGSLVYEAPSNRQGLAGYIARHELTFEEGAPIGDLAQELSREKLLSLAAPLETVIELLADHRFLFVGQPANPAGIVTRYDLNRLAVHHWLYDRFARLEIKLRERIRESDWTYEDSEVSLRSGGAGDLVPDRLANDTLGKLVAIIEEAGLERSIRRDIHGYQATLHDLVELRNAVAHYNTVVHTMSDRHTAESDERGAKQLNQELTLLLDIT